MDQPGRIDFARGRLPLSAWTWHDPAAPPLVLVHGGRDHARSWDRVARAFPDRFVVAPDLRGHGESGWPDDGIYALSDMVGDLLALFDHLDLERVDLVGHSLGGNVVWRLAALFPERVRRLCVIEGLGPTPAKVEASRAQPLAARLRGEVPAGPMVRRSRVYPGLAAATARLREANPRLDAALAEHLAGHGTRAVEGGVVFRHDPALAGLAAIDLDNDGRAALWAAIEAPVLLVHGAESWASNPAEDGRAAAFGNARVISIAGAGHSIHHDRPAEFAAMLRAFLSDPPRDASSDR